MTLLRYNIRFQGESAMISLKYDIGFQRDSTKTTLNMISDFREIVL